VVAAAVNINSLEIVYHGEETRVTPLLAALRGRGGRLTEKSQDLYTLSIRRPLWGVMSECREDVYYWETRMIWLSGQLSLLPSAGREMSSSYGYTG